jgi:selenocysteine lyase/cysteine desulfurase
MFKLVSIREGITNKVVSVPNHPKSDEEIVALYEDQITNKTKLIMVCHQINITGHILPIRKICDMAHGYGVDVLVDGAHCVGQFDVSIDDLGCDYYASSLHKWLSTPLGAGLLYVNKKNIGKIWSFFASGSKDLNDIKRLNHTGTHPVHTDIAISNAIDYINWIGVKKKEERLRFLQRYWSDKLRGKKNIIINTPEDIQRSCGIGNVGLTNMSPGKMAQLLFDEYKIFTVAIDGANVRGCRISPNVFTITEELDSLVNAVTELSKYNA